MKAPNQAYFPYQGSTSKIIPTPLRKPEEKQNKPYIPMYTSAVVPNSNVPSIGSGIRMMSVLPKMAKSIEMNPHIRTEQDNLNDTLTDHPNLGVSFYSIQKHEEQMNKWRTTEEIHKMRSQEVATRVGERESLLSSFRDLAQLPQDDQQLNKLKLDLQSAQQEITSLKVRLELSKQQQKKLKLKHEEIIKQKGGKEQGEPKELNELYQVNLPKMNKDKEFYVFKLIECENTLRQRDLKIAELEKIHRIVVKEMEEAKNKTQGDRSLEVKKYLEREEELIKTITRFKVDANNKDNEIKRLAASNEELEGTKVQLKKTKIEFDQRVEEYELAITQLKTQSQSHQQRIMELSQQLSSDEKVSREKEQQSEQQQVEVLEQKLLLTLKQMQIANSEYEHYKNTMETQIAGLSSSNEKYKEELRVEREKPDTQALSKTHELLAAESEQFKKSAQEKEKILTGMNLSMSKKYAELEGEIMTVKAAWEAQKQVYVKQISELNSRQTKLSESATDVELAPLRALNEQLQEKTKVLELKMVEQEFNAKVMENLETENKYVKETVRIQAAEITFLKKQHLEVIESMITLNHKKLFEDSSTTSKAQRYEDLKLTLDGHQKLFLQKRTISFSDVLESIYILFDKKYSFLKSGAEKESSWKLLGLSTGMSPDAHEQSGYQEDMTVFYEQHFKGLLTLFDIEEEEGCESQLNEKVKAMMNRNLALEEETKSFKERLESLGGSLKTANLEVEKKSKAVEEAAKQIAKLETSIGIAVDKLIKFQQLLDEANQCIVENQLSVLSSRQELIALKQSSIIDKEEFIRQTQRLEVQLKEILNTGDEVGSEAHEKSVEGVNKMDVQLYKLFLKQASRENGHLKEYMAMIHEGLLEDKVLADKYTALWDILQYYRDILEADSSTKEN